jgi:serine/threonine-protein kinase
VGAIVIDQVDRLRAALAGRYELESEIGHGGMAHVYRARDSRHGRDVAIKVLRPELAAALGVERFLREIHLGATLQHPHILPLLDSGSTDGFLYYVMPLVDGETLRERIRREKQLSLPETLRITGEVADALSYAHAHGVLHRDVKPANILLTEEHAVVADFGIAKALSAVDGESLTGTGIAIGTPEYMSPEQGTGEGDVDRRSDIYALGCVVYEMLSGQPPFTGRTVQGVLARHRQEPPPSLRIVRPALSPAVEQVVETALAKVPADRFGTARELSDALAAAASGPVTAAVGARPRLRRAAWFAAALAALAAAWMVAHGRPRSPDPNKVMVFPLLDRGADLPSSAGEDVAIMIGSALEHTEPLKWIDGWTWLEPGERADLRLLSAETARARALAQGARYYIDGSIVRGADSATVVLRLHDARGDSVVTQRSQSGPPGGHSPLAQLGLRAAVGLLPALVEPDRASAGATLAAFADREPAAIANWLQGEREYRRSQFVASLQYFRRAVEADSLLAIASLRGAEAASWAERWDEAPALVRLALRHRELLPLRYQDFATGLRAYYDGEADSALAYFASALAADSSWSEAWMASAEAYNHLLPRAPGALDSLAEAAFEAARRSDSTFTPPLFHLSEMSLRRGAVARAAELAGKFLAASPDSFYARQLGIMLGCARGTAGLAAWNALLPDHAREALEAARALSVAAAYPACAADGFRGVLRATAVPPNLRYGAVIGLQSVLIAQGRPEAAIAALDSAIATGIPAAKGLFVLDAAAGAPTESGAAAAIAELAGRYDSMSGPRLWYHTAWAYHQRRADRLDEIRTALSAVAERTGARSDRLLVEIASGYLALLRGDTTAAIRGFAGLSPVAAPSDLTWGLWESLGDVRLTLARLLLARGRAREAYDIARGFDNPQTPVYLLYLPASLEIRARAADILGESDRAASSRRRLAVLAGPGDPVSQRRNP